MSFPGRDVRLQPVAAIGCHRSAAAESGDAVRAGIQCAYRVSRAINTRRIRHGGAIGPPFCAATTIISRRCVELRLPPAALTREQPSDAGQAHELVVTSGAGSDRPGQDRLPDTARGKIQSIRCSAPECRPLIHVPAADHFAPGATPIWFAAIVTHRGARGVSAMTVVIAGLGRKSRNITAAMNAVVPVEVVIGRLPFQPRYDSSARCDSIDNRYPPRRLRSPVL